MGLFRQPNKQKKNATCRIITISIHIIYVQSETKHRQKRTVLSRSVRTKFPPFFLPDLFGR